jgi:nucleoside 2-deoxyribosyltransferase
LSERITIYLAGPPFTQAERIWNRELAGALESAIPGAEIILPQARAAKFIRAGKPSFKAIAGDCIESIQRADLIVAILDGADADSGTCWECGYAHALGKPIVGVRTDLRASEDDGLNAMLRENCSTLIALAATSEGVAQLSKKIATAVARLRRRSPRR